MIKFWIIVCLVIFGVFAQDSVTNHNGAQHKALCDVLTIAAHKWKTVRETLSPPLKKALGRTLFGKEEGELEELKDLPGDYDKVGEPGSSRAIWCGQPLNGDYQNNYPRWSGHSAPHDLVCLCTVGEGGFPFNKTGSGTAKEKLCGKPANALGGATDGWQSQSASWNKEKRVLEYPDPKGKEHITATWENVTRPCLEGGWKEKNLKKALETLIDNFNHTHVPGYEDIDRLGEGKFDRYRGCTGSSSLGVCVIYYTSFSPQPWWLQLKEAIKEDEAIQKQREKEEKRRQKEEAETQNSPNTEALKSTNPTTNQTEQNRNDNINNTIRRFNLTSGTLISMPSSWLLSVAILI